MSVPLITQCSANQTVLTNSQSWCLASQNRRLVLKPGHQALSRVEIHHHHPCYSATCPCSLWRAHPMWAHRRRRWPSPLVPPWSFQCRCQRLLFKLSRSPYNNRLPFLYKPPLPPPTPSFRPHPLTPSFRHPFHRRRRLRLRPRPHMFPLQWCPHHLKSSSSLAMIISRNSNTDLPATSLLIFM